MKKSEDSDLIRVLQNMHNEIHNMRITVEALESYLDEHSEKIQTILVEIKGIAESI